MKILFTAIGIVLIMDWIFDKLADKSIERDKSKRKHGN